MKKMRRICLLQIILSGTMGHRRGQTTLEMSALGLPLISGITTIAGYLTWADQMNSSKQIWKAKVEQITENSFKTIALPTDPIMLNLIFFFKF